MNAEKIIGFVLLVGGVGLVLWSVWSVYQVFSGQITPPMVVNFELKPISLPMNSSVPGIEMEPLELDMFPTETMNQTTNMVLYLVLMGFISTAGAKLANVGANLLRVMRVYLREGKILEQLKTE